MKITEDERKLSEARARFKTLLGGVKNAVIVKRQRNAFACTFKFPLAILPCVLGAASVVLLAAIVSPPDPVVIVSATVASPGLLFAAALLVRSMVWTLKNAKEAERIYYQNSGGDVTLVTFVAGGGKKAEWRDASLYFTEDGACEIIESGEVAYKPFLAKKVRGHSRGRVLLSEEFLLSRFFTGCEAVFSGENEISLSSGFSFLFSGDVLLRIVIRGYYPECYENNFPAGTFLADSSSYVFTYDFTAVNDPGFVQRFPAGTGPAVRTFGMSPPEHGVVYEEAGESYEIR